MMIKHIWSVLCQSSAVDSQTNNISLFNVFEQFHVNIKTSQPNVYIPKGDISVSFPYELINFWSKDDNGKAEGDVKIRLLDNNNKEIKAMTKHLEIPENNKRMREINKIQDLVLRGDGIYTFEILLRNDGSHYKKVAEIPLEIKINE